MAAQEEEDQNQIEGNILRRNLQIRIKNEARSRSWQEISSDEMLCESPILLIRRYRRIMTEESLLWDGY